MSEGAEDNIVMTSTIQEDMVKTLTRRWALLFMKFEKKSEDWRIFSNKEDILWISKFFQEKNKIFGFRKISWTFDFAQEVSTMSKVSTTYTLRGQCFWRMIDFSPRIRHRAYFCVESHGHKFSEFEYFTFSGIKFEINSCEKMIVILEF